MSYKATLSKSLSALCVPLSLSSCANVEQQQQPNILFIFADDQCYESLYSQERNNIETPNLDRLMNNGAAFRHAHNQGGWSAGVSVASRTMMVTGQYLWRAARVSPTSTNIKLGGTNNPREMPPYTIERAEMPKLWPTMMKEAGYETYMAGKWHVGNTSVKNLFDHTGTVRAGMPNQDEDCYARVFDGVTIDKWSPYDESYGGFWKGGKHWSEVLKEEAVGFLNHSKDSEKPFFMYIGFSSPHDPRQSPKEYVDKYNPNDISVPESFIPAYPYANEIAAGDFLRDEKLAPFPRNERSVQVNRQEYYALITHMDYQIGEILKALDETGQSENTYIIFTADHGIAIGDHGFMGKQNMYERSLRVPLIITGPNIPKGKMIEEYVYLQDIMPTSLEIAGYKKPESVDYNSFLSLAKGISKKSHYKYLYGAYFSVQRMIKGGDYKMIIYPNVNVVRLYNLKDDPNELNDLASDPSQKSRMKKLFTELNKLQKEVADPIDLAPYFDAFMDQLN